MMSVYQATCCGPCKGTATLQVLMNKLHVMSFATSKRQRSEVFVKSSAIIVEIKIERLHS